MNEDHTSTPAEQLNALSNFFKKYLILPGMYGAETLALCVLTTYVVNSFHTVPRVIFSSATPASGKTRGLELVALVAHMPIMTTNMSNAVLFRLLGSAHRESLTPPTILFDETDTIFGIKPTDRSEELRGMINAGYKRGAKVYRCEGDNHTPTEFSCFSLVFLAGLAGNMPDTITTRAVIFDMKKRRPSEKVAAYRERDAQAEIAETKLYLAEWITTKAEDLEHARPELPKGVEDRAAEIWEPLVAIADEVGGHWPETARKACQEFVFRPRNRQPTKGEELLNDIREIMGHGLDTVPPKVDRMRSKELLEKLNWIDDRDSASRYTARTLSYQLGLFGVQPTTFKDDEGRAAKGYVTYPTREQSGLFDAWERYLPPVSTQKTGNSGNHGNRAGQEHEIGYRSDGEKSNRYRSVTAKVTEKVTTNTPPTSSVTEVTAVTDFPAQERETLSAPDVSERYEAITNAVATLGAKASMAKVMREIRDSTGHAADVPDLLDEMTNAGLLILDGNTYRKAA